MIEPLSSMFNRLLRRDPVPTVGDLIRSAESVRVCAPTETIPPVSQRPVPRQARHVVRVEPAPTLPSVPWPPDPYAGVVTGPELVLRTLGNRAAHRARYGDDRGFPVTVWGTFVENHLGHDLPDEEAA